MRKILSMLALAASITATLSFPAHAVLTKDDNAGMAVFYDTQNGAYGFVSGNDIEDAGISPEDYASANGYRYISGGLEEAGQEALAQDPPEGEDSAATVQPSAMTEKEAKELQALHGPYKELDDEAEATLVSMTAKYPGNAYIDVLDTAEDKTVKGKTLASTIANRTPASIRFVDDKGTVLYSYSFREVSADEGYILDLGLLKEPVENGYSITFTNGSADLPFYMTVTIAADTPDTQMMLYDDIGNKVMPVKTDQHGYASFSIAHTGGYILYKGESGYFPESLRENDPEAEAIAAAGDDESVETSAAEDTAAEMKVQTAADGKTYDMPTDAEKAEERAELAGRDSERRFMKMLKAVGIWCLRVFILTVVLIAARKFIRRRKK